MQKRFLVKEFPSPKDAYEYRTALLRNKENEGKVYQVRRGRNGSKEVFRLVERVTISDAKVIQEGKERGRGKRNRKAAVDVSWATS